MRSSLLILLVLITGCSTLSKTTNYEIVQDDSLSRTYVYDWCEESQYTLGFLPPQCSGVYKPPLYSFTNIYGIYVFYPIQIKHEDISIGPVLAPIFPLGYKRDADMSYKIRSLYKGSDAPVKPRKVTFYVNNIEHTSCTLKEEESDGISDIFTCGFEIDTDKIEDFYSLVTFTDETEIKIGYTQKQFWSYRPIDAPAGRDGNSGKYIHIDGIFNFE